MTKKNILTGLMILLISSLLIGACSPRAAAPAASPTLDPQAIYTQAALTVQAGQQLTKAAAPPTNTPAPTATTAPTQSVPTIDPNIAAALTATANAVTKPNTNQPAAGTTPVAGAAPTTPALVIPTATRNVVSNPPPASSTGDKCEWVSNDPADNTKVEKNRDYNVFIKVKNTGTTTWDSTYSLRYFTGERFNAPSDFNVARAVKPNEIYEFAFVIRTPDETGNKELLMVLQAADGRNLCFVNLPLEVVNPGAAQ